MPSFRLIDSHVHFWDPGALDYSWIRANEQLNRPYQIEDYQHDSQRIETEALVFVECDADGGQSVREVSFVEEQAQRDTRLAAIVATAPLELGRAVEPTLREIISRSPKVRGIRRILQSAPDPGALMRSQAFLEGVRLLPELGLHFEITVNYTQMEPVLEFVEQLPEVPMVLAHCGKPGIRDGHIATFRRHARELSRHPHIHCKLSGLTTEANRECWTEQQLLPFIDTTLQFFGPTRVLYGSDWPVCLQTTTLERWVNLIDHALLGCSPSEARMIYRENAFRFYRLGV